MVGFGGWNVEDRMVRAATRIDRNADQVSNSGAEAVEAGVSYQVEVEITGDADLLLHRWQSESVEAKAAAAKGSKAKKTDNVESYVYRNDDGVICLPGEYVRQAMIGAAKFVQDPRSPRKSAVDLVKAAVVSMTPLASLGKSQWDYEDRRRVQVQRNGITRTRPAFKAGWSCTLRLMVNLPEYVDRHMLHKLLTDAGRLIGVGDFRPTYGRFGVTRFEVLRLTE